MTSPPHDPGPLLLQLRQATQRAHSRVEQHALLAPLLSLDLDLVSYRRVLQAFHSYYAALEPGLKAQTLTSLPTQSVGYCYIPRKAILREDLEDIDAGTAVPCAPPDPSQSPIRQTPDHILGWLYVLEGATQGGRVIAPEVSRALGLGETFGARYFNLYKQGQWRSFRLLAKESQTSVSAGRVIQGALDAFENLIIHLDNWNTA